MTFSVNVQPRAAGGAAITRESGFVPGVVYGGGRASSTSIAVRYHDLVKLYHEAGESSLIDLNLSGEAPVKALIQDLQFDPVSDRIMHVDFRQIRMDEEMTATVALSFVGEAPAVKELGGTLVKPHLRVEIKCLPKSLVSHIDVDLTRLGTFTDVIHVGDLPAPSGITITDHADLVVAKVIPPLTEEQLKAMEETAAPVDLSKIEVEKKGKKEEEGEAEAAAAGGGAEEGKKKEEKK